MIEGQTITVESNSGLDIRPGTKGTVLKIVRCFVIVRLENDEIRSCLINGVQPVMTAAAFATVQ